MTEPNDFKNNNRNHALDPVSNSTSDLVEDECAEFQSRMPERISSGEDLQAQPHMLTCERCRSLVRELEYIAEVARQLMPIEAEPRDELWNNIKLAIERGDV